MQIRYLQGISVKESDTVRRAMEILNAESTLVVPVLDELGFFVGIVADGDIRRGMLRGLTMDSSVALVLNATPVIATNVDEARFIVSQLSTPAVPVVNNRELVGIVIGGRGAAGLDSAHDCSVLVMAGGFGSRLGELTTQCPKPMLPIAGVPLLERQLKKLASTGFNNVFISTFYMHDLIEAAIGDGDQFNLDVTYLRERAPLGTAGALGLLSRNENCGRDLLVFNADVLCSIDFRRILTFHRDSNSSVTVGGRVYRDSLPFGVLEVDEDHRLISMVEKPEYNRIINAGIYVIKFDFLKELAISGRAEMDCVINRSLSMTDNVYSFPITELWMDVGTIDEYTRSHNVVDRFFD